MGPGLSDYLMQVVARVPGGTWMATLVLGVVLLVVVWAVASLFA
jgi:hypothetical protein